MKSKVKFIISNCLLKHCKYLRIVKCTNTYSILSLVYYYFCAFRHTTHWSVLCNILMSWLHRNTTESSRPTLTAPATSSHGKRASEAAQGPAKPPRLTTAAASPSQSISPLTKRRREGEVRSLPALKVNIPTILVEDEPMEVDGEGDDGLEVKGCRSRPRSSVKGRSNNYLTCTVFGIVIFSSSFLIFYFLVFLRAFSGCHQWGLKQPEV